MKASYAAARIHCGVRHDINGDAIGNFNSLGKSKAASNMYDAFSTGERCLGFLNSFKGVITRAITSIIIAAIAICICLTQRCGDTGRRMSASLVGRLGRLSNRGVSALLV